MVEIRRTYQVIEYGNKYLRLSLKEGQFGTFLSLDQGIILETENGNEPMRSRPNRFFTLPMNAKALRKLSEALQKIAEQLESNKEVNNVDENSRETQ